MPVSARPATGSSAAGRSHRWTPKNRAHIRKILTRLGWDGRLTLPAKVLAALDLVPGEQVWVGGAPGSGQLYLRAAGTVPENDRFTQPATTTTDANLGDIMTALPTPPDLPVPSVAGPGQRLADAVTLVHSLLAQGHLDPAELGLGHLGVPTRPQDFSKSRIAL